MQLDRRELLFSGTTALAIGLAGCAAEPLDGDEEENETDDSDTEGNDSDGNDTDGNESDGEDLGNDTDDGGLDENGTDETDDNDTDDSDNGTSDGFGDDETDGNGTDDDNDTDTDNGTDDADGETNGTDGNESEGNDTDDNGTDDETDGNDTDDDPAGSGDVEAPPQHPITVTVFGPAGERVEGATVHGTGESLEADVSTEFVAETDAQGVYTDEVYENEYTIEVSHPNFESATVDHVHDGESELTVELESAEGEPDTSLLRLWVTNAVGDPIEGAEVAGVGDSHPADIPLEFSGETDGEGLYDDVIYENQYTIEVSHPDYVTKTVEHSHEGESDVVVALEAEGEPGTAGLTLRVVDGNGDPIEGASVLGTGEPTPGDVPLEFSGETNGNGVYGDVIYKNTYTIEIDHPDYAGTTLEHDHRMDTDIEVELQAQSEAALTVRAVHPVSGEPVSGVTVSVAREDGTGRELEAETGPTGLASFDVEPAEYRIVAYERELYRTNPMATVVTVGEDPRTVQVRAVVEPEDCTAPVEVVDGGTGDPVENATVSVDVARPDHGLMENPTGETGADGTVEITTWCGEWTISARADGYNRVPQEQVRVAGDRDEPITIEL
ncbi:carboxypeptidase-like regulatory domain-containing protein [Saliphagus infecundisoli]|uniref:Carboxypeptidase-like regulatory domain-containing protein n=1 Tax=Saliphagus infecundisoli TaxID=1849069 RepID=A0ABD5QIC7_9EURY|nr:carboxypeptidase-like regulatory domain-containing protein [Saliphagus infecundisoli]